MCIRNVVDVCGAGNVHIFIIVPMDANIGIEGILTPLRDFRLLWYSKIVTMVDKTSGSRRYPERLAELVSLAGELGVGERFVCVNSYLPQDEIYALTAACDVYASLHRGEGFGLGIAEAMSLGKPVVVTEWSAPLEFCRRENALLVCHAY